MGKVLLILYINLRAARKRTKPPSGSNLQGVKHSSKSAVTLFQNWKTYQFELSRENNKVAVNVVNYQIN